MFYESPHLLWRSIDLGKPEADEYNWLWYPEYFQGRDHYWDALIRHFTEVQAFPQYAKMVEDWHRPNAVTLQVPEHLLEAYCAPGSVKFLNEGVEPPILFLQVYRSADFSTTTHLVFDIGEVESDQRAYEILDRLGADELTEQEMGEQRQSPATFASFLQSAPFLESLSPDSPMVVPETSR